MANRNYISWNMMLRNKDKKIPKLTTQPSFQGTEKKKKETKIIIKAQVKS